MAAIRLGYNTNGFPYHALEDAVEILAEIGYVAVALTPDVHHLNPFTATPAEVDRLRGTLERLGLARVVETGARFLLDPRRKHWPSLISRDGSERRMEFLRSCLRLAARLGAPIVSFWSGESDGRTREAELVLLADACRKLLDQAEALGVGLSLEPEPGMLVADLSSFEALDAMLGDLRLGLTLDVGHLHLTEPVGPAKCLRAWRSRLVNVHLDDMRKPVHEHLAFGSGEIDFQPVFRVLGEIDFRGVASVELSRHGHDAVQEARRAMEFLRPFTEEP